MRNEYRDQGPGARGQEEECAARGGFTLVELMVVIVIIIILMGLLTPVLMNVMAKAREARIVAEISAMDGALKAYKERYGSYPPSDFSSTGIGLVQAHLLHAFPRCNISTEMAAIQAAGLSTASPAQALVFWLSGFCSDPEHPVSGHYSVSANGYTTPSPPLALTPFYPFDTTRLTGTPPVYAPIDGLGAPYLYFAAQNYATQAAYSASTYGQGGTGVGRPYYLDGGVSTISPQFLYANPNTYQIISAGLDGDYGDTSATTAPSPYPSYPSGSGYTAGDMDNLTNIIEKNLKDAIPH